MPYRTEEDLKITNDEAFKPTFYNTVVFLMQMLSQACIFLFNHGGEPHMEGLEKSRK